MYVYIIVIINYNNYCSRYDHILENNKPEDFSNEKVLQQAVKVTQLVRNDIQRSIEIFDKHFYL